MDLLLICLGVLATPIHELDIFRSGEYRKRLSGAQAGEKHAFLQGEYPQTRRAAFETIWIPQPVLLGDGQDMQDIADAWVKIQKLAEELV